MPIPLQIQNVIHILNSKLYVLVQASNFLPWKIISAFNSLHLLQLKLRCLETLSARSLQARRHFPVLLPGKFCQHNRTHQKLLIHQLGTHRAWLGDFIPALRLEITLSIMFAKHYQKGFYKHQALYKTNFISNLISRTWVICSHSTMLKLLTIIGDQSAAGYSHGSSMPAFTDYDSWKHSQMLTTPTLRQGINLVFIGRKEKKKARVKWLIHNHTVAQLSQRPLATSPAP